MKKALEILARLEKDGLFEKFAVGGAMGATFYIEPVVTYDLDIFIFLPKTDLLITLTPLYSYLKQLGYSEQGECVVIEGVPVQFLPAFNPLTEEALTEAVYLDYDSVMVPVFRAEHLMAICLQTGRAKDKDRLRLFQEETKIDNEYFAGILKRHGLEEKWNDWKK